MSTGLIYHADVDGLYSAKLIMESGYKIDEIYAVDYGKNYSHIINDHDDFISVDFAENIAGEKTKLFIDHHIRSERANGAQKEIIKNAQSCVSLLINEKLVDTSVISSSAIECINTVDSANYSKLFDNKFTAVDVLFPNIETELGMFILLNDLLRKNRKFNLSLSLVYQETFDIKSMLYIIQKSNNNILKYDKYMEMKMKLFEKLKNNVSKYVKEFSGIPALFTRKFTPYDWKGYDKNILNFLYNDKMFTMLIFEMGGSINVQIQKNPFFITKNNISLYEIIKGLIDEPRGHDNILMLSFNNLENAIKKLDKITTLISEHI